jgi:tetratricopeptide (TPR) repeat protein
MNSLGIATGLVLALASLTTDDDAISHRAIGYICSAEHAAAAGSEHRLVMVPGVGSGGFSIKTDNPEAQAWFNYGMQLAHAFYHADAKAAFLRASTLDPACAMCLWGQAWARGPTLNFDVSPDETKAAAALAAKAETLAGGESPKNRALIAALKARCVADTAVGDLAFAKAMDALARQYPQDAEAAIMTSDAWLILARSHDDFQGVPRAVSVLEPVLRRDPNDTGAIHFYIHATEMDGQPALALPYAERLGALAPGASHLVHMASHTYFRVGRYEDAAVANAAAIAADGAYLRAEGDTTPQGKVVYHGHDLRFGLAASLASGDGPLALRLAQHDAYAYPDSAALSDSQSIAGWAYIAYARYAPEKALALADPGKGAPFARALWRYARGEALAAKRDAVGVRAEAAQLAVPKDAFASAPADARAANMAVVEIAQLTLKGRAAMLDGDYAGAIAAYGAAARIQEARLSDWTLYDPPRWWYPERRSLAAALLAAGEPARAAEEARRALDAWPNEPMSLQVLAQAEARLGQADAARKDASLAQNGWRGAAMDLGRI